MKKVSLVLATVLGSMVPAALLAHPGDHGELTASEHISHMGTDPWHLAMLLAIAAAAIALRHSARQRERRDR